jgi:hypothetical protein
LAYKWQAIEHIRVGASLPFLGISRNGASLSADPRIPMSRVDDLIEQIQVLEEEMLTEFDKRRDDFRSVMDQRRASFSEEVSSLQRRPAAGLFRYLFTGSLLNWLSAPVIYLGFVPMLLLDAFLFIYQAVCFPVYGIPKAKRSDYVILDRADLPYLNALERLNCFFCGYANGLASYFREIAARTEQYWCPIKHARRINAAHDRYPTFFENGDAESYRLGLERLRDALATARDER